MENDVDEEVEIKIEYNDTYDKDPLSEKRFVSLENVLLESEDTNDFFSSEVSSQNLNKFQIASKLEHGRWHRNQDNTGRYVCKYCELSYLSIQTLRHHVKIKHPDEAKMLKTTMVMNKRSSKLKCHICKKRFKVLRDLQNHVTEQHETELIKFSCHFCNAAFSNCKEINNHLYLKHKTDVKTVKIKYCNICGYRTLKRSHFSQHLNSHFQQKTVKCQFCDYTSDRTSNLKIHERIHMDLKPYLCDHKDCNYKSAAKSALKSHQLKHRREENMLYCDKCSYKTVYKQSLKKHRVSHTKKA